MSRVFASLSVVCSVLALGCQSLGGGGYAGAKDFVAHQAAESSMAQRPTVAVASTPVQPQRGAADAARHAGDGPAHTAAAPGAVRYLAEVRAEAEVDGSGYGSRGLKPWELTLNGAGFSDETFNGGQFSIGGSLGRFLTNDLEVAVRQTTGYSDVTNNWSGSTRVAADYHFGDDHLRPFVGASAGYVYGGEFRDTWAIGPEAGVKFFVDDDTFIYGSLGYDFFSRKATNEEGDFRNGQFVYGVGIGFRW